MLTILGKSIEMPLDAAEMEQRLRELQEWKIRLVAEGRFEQSAAVRDAERRLIKETAKGKDQSV
jgi:protein-arginine kinase activator protein McsA